MKTNTNLTLVGLALAACSGCLVHANVFRVTNTDDRGLGSLRQAILDANASPDTTDKIKFSIPGAGPHSIRPQSPRPPRPAFGVPTTKTQSAVGRGGVAGC